VSGEILVATVMGTILLLLLAIFVAFFFYSRTPAWRTSELRMATMRFLFIVGPFFGVHVDMPEPTPTSVSTPGPDPPPGMEGIETSPPEARSG
jgi:hypothetical protein